jgi:hypothetical protein
MTEEYVDFDEFEDVLSSMDLLAFVVPLANQHPSYWKWIVITSQAALQGAMVCALAATSRLPVLERQSAREMRQWLETQEGHAPQERLADFNTLLKKMPSKRMHVGQTVALGQSSGR